MAQIVQVVDDDPDVRFLIADNLRQHHLTIIEAEDAASGWQQFQSEQPALSIVDIGLPGGEDGIDLLRRIHQIQKEHPVLIISGEASPQQAVEAMKLGAYDYLGKPINFEKLRLLVDRGLETVRRHRSIERIKVTLKTEYGFERLLGSSSIFQELISAAKRVAEVPAASVLLTGESGTGKELFARAIHCSSSLAHEAFIGINCAAVPETLLEAELFGHEKGAFTDAKQRKSGLLEEANRGTLFLDEIGDIPFNLQAKFLRVLEEHAFRRLGGTQLIHVQFRLVVATNANLEKLVAAKKFREDLYYRLNVIHLHLPPLRERGNDVIEIAHSFLKDISQDFGRENLTLTPSGEQVLLSHPWPGNVRELKNILQRAVILADGNIIEDMHLASSLQLVHTYEQQEPALLSPTSAMIIPPDGMSMDEIERMLIQSALRQTKGNVTAAARLLKMSREKLRYRIRKFGLRVMELSHDLKESSDNV
ncbi:sigma-54 dependent transcriptional regulator [bacterium]|nr:sigma-54 dependent transcriptional regulator [bacterium]MBU1936747.1 sigma-54 dependent transcriptional regulator [bacterium]